MENRIPSKHAEKSKEWMASCVRSFCYFSLVTGTATAANIDLSSVTTATAGFRIAGAAAFDSAGCAFSAGDVNGDGFGDMIVGADGASFNARTDCGVSYVIFGKASALDNINLASFASADGFRIVGAAAGDRSGYSVSSAGDVNGDGYADMIVGCQLADNNSRNNSGSSYVIFGKLSGFSDIDLDTFSTAGLDGFRIDGAAINDGSGHLIAYAGDVNGDGYGDVIVGAPSASNNGRTESGSSYVIFGKSSGFANIDLASLSAADGFRIDGQGSYDKSGISVSSAGDVNGDGYGDVIVGAFLAGNNGRDDSGSGYVVFGKSSGFANIDLASLSAADGFRIDGASFNHYSCRVVDGAGDVNGDGCDDIIVGTARAGNNSRSFSGSSYVVFGKPTGLANVDLATFSSAGPHGFRIDGAVAGDRAGVPSSAGDINGDGFADIIVGAYSANNNSRSDSGSCYLVFGKATGFTNIDLATFPNAGTQGFRLDGAAADDFLGTVPASAGDVNGDGYVDLMVGTGGSDVNGSGSGASYIIFGGRDARRYFAHTPPGNTARRAIGTSNRNPDPASGAWLDFDGGTAVSTETVTQYTLGRSPVKDISPMGDINDTLWQIATTRTGWSNCVVTLKYPKSAEPFESDLKIYKAESPSGPWTRLTTTVNTTRNEASATVTDFSWFALGKSNVLPLGLTRFHAE
jgi:hypothetical protein